MLGNNATRDAEIAAAVSAALAAANVRPVPVATAAPLASSRPLATPARRGGPRAFPRASAIVQSATLNAELAAAVPVLQIALAAKNFDAYPVFQASARCRATPSPAGSSPPTSAAGRAASELETSLVTFYTAVQATASEGLDASIHNEAAYRAAATEMLRAARRAWRGRRPAPRRCLQRRRHDPGARGSLTV